MSERKERNWIDPIDGLSDYEIDKIIQAYEETGSLTVSIDIVLATLKASQIALAGVRSQLRGDAGRFRLTSISVGEMKERNRRGL